MPTSIVDRPSTSTTTRVCGSAPSTRSPPDSSATIPVITPGLAASATSSARAAPSAPGIGTAGPTPSAASVSSTRWRRWVVTGRIPTTARNPSSRPMPATRKTPAGPVAASSTPPPTDPTSTPTFSTVPDATFAAVSSDGVRAIVGSTAAWAGRTSVSACAPTITAAYTTSGSASAARNAAASRVRSPNAA